MQPQSSCSRMLPLSINKARAFLIQSHLSGLQKMPQFTYFEFCTVDDIKIHFSLLDTLQKIKARVLTAFCFNFYSFSQKNSIRWLSKSACSSKI